MEIKQKFIYEPVIFGYNGWKLTFFHFLEKIFFFLVKKKYHRYDVYIFFIYFCSRLQDTNKIYQVH